MLTAGPLSAQAEVEETLKRIQDHKGVVGMLLVNAEGKPSAALPKAHAW